MNTLKLSFLLVVWSILVGASFCFGQPETASRVAAVATVSGSVSKLWSPQFGLPSINSAMVLPEVQPVYRQRPQSSTRIFRSRFAFGMSTIADSTKQKSAKNPTGAMLRSAIFPGWGQFYNGKYLKAVLVFGLESGLLANAIYQNQKVVRSKTAAEKEFYSNNRNLSNWYLLATVLLSMLDAYVDAHLADFDESPTVTMTFDRDDLLGGGPVPVAYAIGLRFNL